VEICDSVIKLLLVIGLAYINADKLLAYAILMASIQLLNLFIFSLYAKLHFPECSLTVRKRDVDRQAITQLIGFAGWTTYGAGALAARNQGINVIINHFAGTVANAAYGVAAQVNAAIFFVSSSIVNAMNPQIMRAEGESDRQRVLKLASQESKYSAILLSIAAIPMLFEMPTILALWLKEVPENTAMFCTFTLASCLVDQFTIGLNAVNQAQGKIGTYSMLMFTPKLLVLPIAWWQLHTGSQLVAVMWTYIIVEAIVAAIRIPFMKATAGLHVTDYLKHTVLPLLPLIATMMLVSWACTQYLHFPFRFMFTVPVSILGGLLVAWQLSLSGKERQYITKLIRGRLGR
jgi:O-antigen/teichoic acid export membrane protein